MLKDRRSELLLILAALMFASNGISSKLLLEGHISAWRLAQVRAIGAASILAIYLWRKAPHNLRLKKAEIPRLAALGAFGIAAVNGTYFLAISRMHVSMALLIEFTAPVWIVLYLRFIKGKFVPHQMWIALVLALTGLAFVAQVWDGLTLDGIGVIAAFTSAIAVAIYFVLGEKVSKTRDSLSITMWGFFFAALTWCLLLPIWKFPTDVFTVLISLGGPFGDMKAPGWVLILYVVLIGTIGPYLCTIVALKNLSASTTSAFGMLEPIFVGGIAWFWFGESWTFIQLIGGVIVIAGIYMADLARSKTI
jgi:drug/metabolite transporter (DMT)-like permease